MRFQKLIIGAIAGALLIKVVLFLYIVFKVPKGIFSIDSSLYLRDAQGWVDFFCMPSGGLKHSLYRTPGYPFFLTVFHGSLKMALWGVILIQLVLNVLTAALVYKITAGLGRGVSLLSAAIVLLDLPTTIYSMMILTESLHLVVIAVFLFVFIQYINDRSFKSLIMAGLILTISVYVRPVGYYLGFAVAGFIIVFSQRDRIGMAIKHAILFLFLVYSLVGVWEYKNLKDFGQFTLCNIDAATIRENCLFGAYARENNPDLRRLPPAVYYFERVSKNFLVLMTTSGSVRNLGSPYGRVFWVIFGYLLVIFWWIGLIAGIFKDKKDVVYVFLMMVVLYFISVTLVSIGWGVTARMRIPMVPALAILSARGWYYLTSSKKCVKL